MLGASVTLDKDAIGDFAAYFDAVARFFPAEMPKWTTVAGLAVCKSLKARTRKAPRKAPSKEYRAKESDLPPKYITYRRGQKLTRPLIRWSLTRKIGTPAEYTKHHFVYTHMKTTYRKRMGMKNGHYQGIVTRKVTHDASSERRELLALHGGIARAGLARASWGWIAQDIYGQGRRDVSYDKRHMRRDPANAVDGKRTSSSSGVLSYSGVTIHNRLDYITAAVASGAVEEASASALKSVAWKLERAVAAAARNPGKRGGFFPRSQQATLADFGFSELPRR